MHACEHNAHKRACTFLYLSIAFEQCKFGDDEESEICSGRSNIYSQQFLLLRSDMCMHASTMHINVSIFGNSF